jgi:cellulose synthase/poly-beta-1,6-N-acetylglucosamine synthase-like glycosyltransferase
VLILCPSTVGGMLLWVFEVFAAVLACAYLWELCDALGTEDWRRRVTPDVLASQPARYLPFVSLHVPAHNEPPGMVIDTLTSLSRLDYSRLRSSPSMTTPMTSGFGVRSRVGVQAME